MSQICYQWGNANILWNNADWHWSLCQTTSSGCAVWGTTQFLWKDAAWWWIQCGNIGPQPPQPPQPTTESLGFLQPLGVDATTLIQPWIIEPWNPYRLSGSLKKKKMITLTCKVNGVIFEQKKETDDRSVSVNGVTMEIGSFNNIDLDVRLEE